jgi:predicted hydrolase (HD superfamily)
MGRNVLGWDREKMRSFEDLGVDGKVILKWLLTNMIGGCRLQ